MAFRDQLLLYDKIQRKAAVEQVYQAEYCCFIIVTGQRHSNKVIEFRASVEHAIVAAANFKVCILSKRFYAGLSFLKFFLF